VPTPEQIRLSFYHKEPFTSQMKPRANQALHTTCQLPIGANTIADLETFPFGTAHLWGLRAVLPLSRKRKLNGRREAQA
jgi:hypothetical protein